MNESVSVVRGTVVLDDLKVGQVALLGLSAHRLRAFGSGDGGPVGFVSHDCLSHSQ